MSDKRKLSQHTSQAGNMQRRRPHNETSATSSSPLISHSCGTVAFAFLARLHHNAAAGARLRLRCEHAQVTSMLQSEVTFPLRASDMMQARPTGAADRAVQRMQPKPLSATTRCTRMNYTHNYSRGRQACSSCGWTCCWPYAINWPGAAAKAPARRDYMDRTAFLATPDR